MNMLEKYIEFEKNNIALFAKEVLSDYYDEEIFAKLLAKYIEARYYNFYSEKDSKMEDTIFERLNKTVKKLLDESDEETKEKISEMYVLFNYVLCFDEVNIIKDNTLVRLLSDYRFGLFGLKDSIFEENMKRLISTTRLKRKKLFDYFHTDDFYLRKYTTSKDNVISVELNHKINFPKLYSDYAIDRVFHEGNINEDRMLVEYYLVTSLIIKDIKECIYDQYYLVEFATSLFDDKEKLAKTLEITSNDCFKNQTIFKISYADYVKYTNSIKDLIREGYKFSISIEDDTPEDDFILFNIFEYIVVNNNSKYCATAEENDKILIINDKW